jgi:hypothetical protein
MITSPFNAFYNSARDLLDKNLMNIILFVIENSLPSHDSYKGVKSIGFLISVNVKRILIFLF